MSDRPYEIPENEPTERGRALLDALEAAEAALEDWACFECDDSMPMRDRSGDDGCPLCQRALAALSKIRALREGDEG